MSQDESQKRTAFPPEFGNETHTVALFRRTEPSEIIGGNDRIVYQWGDNRGVPFSPVLDSIEEAFKYPNETGLKPLV